MTLCPAPTRIRSAALAAAIASPVIVATLAGCGLHANQPPDARTTITLPQNVPLPPSPGAAPPRALPTRTITLAPGQSFAVSYLVSAAGTQWAQAIPGDSRILRQTSAIAHTCPPDHAGCGEAASTAYTARTVGDTTVRWSLIMRDTCEHGPQPCPAAIQTIHVIVQR